MKSVVPGDDDSPSRVIEIAVEPKTKNDQERWPPALPAWPLEDLSFRGGDRPRERGQTIMKGAWASFTSTSWSIVCAASSRSRPISGAPQVAYRETISRKAEIDYTHKK